MTRGRVEGQRLRATRWPSELALVARGVSRRGRPCSCSAGSSCGPTNGQLALAATDMELSLRTSLEADVRRRRRGRRPGPPAARHRARAARRRRVARVPAATSRCCRSRRARRATACTRTRPRTSRGCPTSTAIAAAAGRPRGAARDDQPRQPLGVARREPAGADRHPRPLRAGQARHGRDRLLPARGQGDPRREHAAGARGDHPGPRAPGARRASPPAATRSSSACTRTTSSSAPTTRG